jgi:hypothetical protein
MTDLPLTTRILRRLRKEISKAPRKGIAISDPPQSQEKSVICRVFAPLLWKTLGMTDLPCEIGSFLDHVLDPFGTPKPSELWESRGNPPESGGFAGFAGVP